MNTSGINPIEYNVLVGQDIVEQKTSGGLIMPDTVVDKENFSQTRGKIVAMSPMAFAFEDWPDGVRKPEVGQRILFAKHSGKLFKGDDDEEYRIVKDRDILAVLEGGAS